MRTRTLSRDSQKPRPGWLWWLWLALPTLAIVALPPVSARAEVIRTATSVTFTGSITGSAGPVSVAATLWADPAAPDVLNLLLQNTSPAATTARSGLLTSFYFGVYGGTSGGTAPGLTYVSGSGQVYRAVTAGPDVPGVWIPPSVGGSGTFTPYASGLSNLMATASGDLTWQFKSGLALAASEPPLNFGIGTVGNSSLFPNSFNGNVVDGDDFGIYAGDAQSQSLASVGLLVSGSARFQFSGFGGYTTNQIPDHAVFGLGSRPDDMISVPEPGTFALALAGAAAALGLRIRRRSAEWPSPCGRPHPRARSRRVATGARPRTCAACAIARLPFSRAAVNGWSCRDGARVLREPADAAPETFSADELLGPRGSFPRSRRSVGRRGRVARAFRRDGLVRCAEMHVGAWLPAATPRR